MADGSTARTGPCPGVQTGRFPRSVDEAPNHAGAQSRAGDSGVRFGFWKKRCLPDRFRSAGRWLSADTIVPEPGKPQAYNRYTYVEANPLRYLDPTGHSKFTDWLIEQGKKIGNSGPIGKALVVSAAEATNHVNQQTQKVFYPDENTDPIDRFWACVEIGSGASLAAAPVAYGGSLAIGAIGGGSALAEAGGTAATASCADGDCLNEAQATERIIETGWTTLGKYPQYLNEAKRIGSNVFNMAKTEWDALGSRAAQWAKNVEFLDDAIARGDSFRLATPFAEGWAERGTWYKDELVYLLQKGYELVTDVNGWEWLIKVGE